MEIKSLPKDVQTLLRSGASINTVTQCIIELVLNSLDAKSTAIAVRVNLLTFRIQVVDNGIGITEANMNVIGKRYMTNKCQSLADLKRIKTFGFRGEALSSICEMSKKLTIESRSTNTTDHTYRKIHQNNKWGLVETMKQRPSQGTTVTVEDFMYNLPVRQKRIHNKLDLDEIKRNLELLAIIYPNISFNLRNECTGKIILQCSKTDSVSQAFSNLFPDIPVKDFAQIKFTKKQIHVSGLIYKNNSTNYKLQLLYVNKRPITAPQIQKLIKSLLMKSLIFQTNNDTTKHPVYILNIRCPYSEIDLTFEASKASVEFKNLNFVLNCMEQAIKIFLKKEKLIKLSPLQQTEQCKPDVLDTGELRSQFGLSEIDGAIRSKPVKRKLSISQSNRLTGSTEKKEVRNDFSDKRNTNANKKMRLNKNIPKNVEKISIIKENRTRMRSSIVKDIENLPGLETNQEKEANDPFYDNTISEISDNDFKRPNAMKIPGIRTNHKPRKTTKENVKNRKGLKRKNLLLESSDEPEKGINLLRKNEMKHRKLQLIKEDATKQNAPVTKLFLKESTKPKTIFDRHANTQSLVLNSEWNTCKTSRDDLDLLNSSVNTETLQDQEKGKHIIMEMFLKSTLAFPHKGTITEDNRTIKTVVIETRTNKDLFTHCKSRSTVMTTSMRIRKTMVTNTTCPVEKFSRCSNTKQPQITKQKMVSKCVQTAMTGKQYKANDNLSFLNDNNSSFLFGKRVSGNLSISTFSKYFKQPSRDYREYFKNQFQPRLNCVSTSNDIKNFDMTHLLKPDRFRSRIFENDIEYNLNYNSIHNRDYFHDPNLDGIIGKRTAVPQIPRNAFDPKFDYIAPDICYENYLNQRSTRNDTKTRFPNFHLNFPNENQNFTKYRRWSNPFNFYENDSVLPRKNEFDIPLPSFDFSIPIYRSRNPTKRHMFTKNYNDLFKSYEPHNEYRCCKQSYQTNEKDKRRNPFEEYIKNKNEIQNTRRIATEDLYNSALKYSNTDFLLSHSNENFQPKTRRYQDLLETSKHKETTKIDSKMDCTLSPFFRRHSKNISRYITEFKNQYNVVNENIFRDLNRYPSKMNHEISRKFKKKPLLFPSHSKMNLRNQEQGPSIEMPILEKNPFYSVQRKILQNKRNTIFPSLASLFDENPSDPETKFEFDFGRSHKENFMQENLNKSHHQEKNTVIDLSFCAENFKPIQSSTHQFILANDSVIGSKSKNETASSSIIETTPLKSTYNFPSNLCQNSSNDKPRSSTRKLESNVTVNKSMGSLKESPRTKNYNLDKNTNTDLNPFDLNLIVNNNNQSAKDTVISNSNLEEPFGAWTQKIHEFNNTFYIHKRTGMTAMCSPKIDDNFHFSKRFDFVPKGLSPILKEKKEIEMPFSPTSKQCLLETILKSYENELSTIKWLNYIENSSDVNKFFEELYKEKAKQFEKGIPNAEVSKLPRSMIRSCKNVQARYFTKDIFNDLKVIGQWDTKFIITLCKKDKLLILFDQHAVHERVRLEKLLDDYTEVIGNNVTRIKSTKVKVEMVLSLLDADLNVLSNFEDIFNNSGIFYKCHEKYIEITRIPVCIYKKFDNNIKGNEQLCSLIASLVYEQIEMITETRGVSSKIPKTIQNVINSEACRGAIKFGDKLSMEECTKCILDLSHCNLPFQCAHGRPSLTLLVDFNKNFQITKRPGPNLKSNIISL